jgi:maltooligosyltrehalose trehalohydrolase
MQRGGGAHFRLWAPDRQRVSVEINGLVHALSAESDGYFSGLVQGADVGDDYGFRLDDDDTVYPDPVSRCQLSGPHGPSRLVDPASFLWTDASWKGVGLKGQVIYELHVGTFTPEGTWSAAAEKLPLLADVGISVIEMMPVAEFPGSFGWGYDGVDLFAPTRLYGSPDDLRRFINAAHAIGIGVILDVVYNHFGPDGNYMTCFAADYFSKKYDNEWGDPINFDGANSAAVREFFVTNAAYWIEEFRFDGLRLDATQQIFDDSADNIMAAIACAVRKAANGRETIILGENEPQQSRLIRPTGQGGYALDGLWNDDFHHSAVVALTGRREAYYSDYHGRPQELIAAVRHGFLMQGQRSAWQKKPRGTPAFGIEPFRFVTFIENHDQIANNGSGKRLHQQTSPGRFRAITALMLLAPGSPMLFQGQEFSSRAPFLYFADHKPDLAEDVSNGRREFLTQFESLVGIDVDEPAEEHTFKRCILDWTERGRNVHALSLHRDLIALRRNDPVFAAQEPVDGAVLDSLCFVLRFFGKAGDDRLLLLNLGPDLTVGVLPEPLLAPPLDGAWKLLWSSEDPAYDGSGVRPLSLDVGWVIPGEAAIVLAPT